jgi:hypothetical protein
MVPLLSDHQSANSLMLLLPRETHQSGLRLSSTHQTKADLQLVLTITTSTSTMPTPTLFKANSQSTTLSSFPLIGVLMAATSDQSVVLTSSSSSRLTPSLRTQAVLQTLSPLIGQLAMPSTDGSLMVSSHLEPTELTSIASISLRMALLLLQEMTTDLLTSSETHAEVVTNQSHSEATLSMSSESDSTTMIPISSQLAVTIRPSCNSREDDLLNFLLTISLLYSTFISQRHT